MKIYLLIIRYILYSCLFIESSIHYKYNSYYYNYLFSFGGQGGGNAAQGANNEVYGNNDDDEDLYG